LKIILFCFLVIGEEEIFQYRPRDVVAKIF